MTEASAETPGMGKHTVETALAEPLGKLQLQDAVPRDQLVEALVKLCILDYRTEPRFGQPLATRAPSASSDVRSSSSGAAGRGATDAHCSERSSRRFSKLLHSSSDYKLSSETVVKLKERLNAIAMQKSGNYEEITRRSLLRYYNELLQTTGGTDKIKNPEQLVVRFVACATKEINKVGSIPKEQTSNAIYKQTETFISLLMDIVAPEKHSDAMTKKLQDLKKSMRPSTYTLYEQQQQQQADQAHKASLEYQQPSFQITDMTLAQAVARVCGIDKTGVQAIINILKESVNEATLVQELKEVLHEFKEQSLEIPYQLEDFDKIANYLSWKAKEEKALAHLIDRFQPKQKQKASKTQRIIPREKRAYLMATVKLCVMHDRRNGTLLSNSSQELLDLCCKIWRIDQFARATYIYSALTEIFEQEAFDEQALNDFYNLYQSYRLDQTLWPKQIRAEWSDDLASTYVYIMKELRENLTRIYSETRPRFGPLLETLARVEADPLFAAIRDNSVPQKWEKRMAKSLLRIAELRYVEVISEIPRDKSLDLSHVAVVGTRIIEDARLLSKRYPSALLGFLQVPQVCAGLSTAMFAADAKNMLLHIKSHADDAVNYGDAMEVYKILHEIRSIFRQVSAPEKQFKFDIEAFFYTYVDEWCEDSGEKIIEFINTAVREDRFKPVDLENDKLYSSSIIDTFAMVNQSFAVLRDLKWADEYQYARFVTKLLKFVSFGIMDFAELMMELMVFDLDNQTVEAAEEPGILNNTTEWLKNTVAANTSKAPAAPPVFDFKPRTCVALNNLEALLTNFQKLEEMVDPETASSIIRSRERSANATSHLFSIRIMRAENLKHFGNSARLPDTYVSLVDGQNKRRIAKTRIVKNHLSPEWDEEFEIVIPSGASVMLGATVWDCSSKLGAQNVSGRTVINLQPSRFNADGAAQEIELDLDTQGKLVLQISMESERDDAIFSMGRALRAVTRMQERSVKLIVEKFLSFVEFSISRSTLKVICGRNGQKRPSVDLARTALEPLFDYLNMNFQVLASNLSETLLLKVILQTWVVVLGTVDTLLLPKLSSAKNSIALSALKLQHRKPPAPDWQKAMAASSESSKGASSQELSTTTSAHSKNSSMSSWQSVVSNAMNSTSGGSTLGKAFRTNNKRMSTSSWQNVVSNAMSTSIVPEFSVPGFGKPLTNQEVEVVFEWLKVLCFEFFHNNGAGPSIEELKNEKYQELLLVPVYYDRDATDLKAEVERFSPATLKLIREKHYYSIGSDRPKPADSAAKLSKVGTMARRKSVAAMGSARQRALAAKEYQEARADPIAAQADAENLVLRMLLLKGEAGFVHARLEQRERLSKSIAAEFFARLAAEGTL